MLNHAMSARLLPSEVNALLSVLRKRAIEKVPTAYITHEAWIGDYSFYIDERAIIPRSFIGELLVNDQLQTVMSTPAEDIQRVLELCTGNGSLAILAALHFPNAQVDAVDLSPAALEIARKNVADYGLSDRVRLHHGDMFQPLTRDTRYDLIISNPPYVPADEMAELDPEYKHEPTMALDGGKDGLDFVRTLMSQAPRFLSPRGSMVVEAGPRKADIEKLYPGVTFTWMATASGADEDVFLVDTHALAPEGSVTVVGDAKGQEKEKGGKSKRRSSQKQ